MRRICLAALSACLALAPLPSAAAPPKTLQNIKGNVVYQTSATATAQPVAPQASIALGDSAYAITGPSSMAAIGLPDSSRVLIGQSSKVQLVSFTQTATANANFVLVPPSKTRFTVEHPAGAHASYTFQTPLGQIAVRGTVGDIATTPTSLQVNVYDVSDPTLPVVVTLQNGRVFLLGKGGVLVANLNPDGTVQTQQSQVTTPSVQPFSEFGLPSNARELGLLEGTQTAAAGGAAAVAGAPVNAIWALLLPVIAAPILVGANHGVQSQPPAPRTGSTSVPITTQIRHRDRVQIRFVFPIRIP